MVRGETCINLILRLLLIGEALWSEGGNAPSSAGLRLVGWNLLGATMNSCGMIGMNA